jgi:hypothetical protein
LRNSIISLGQLDESVRLTYSVIWSRNATNN